MDTVVFGMRAYKEGWRKSKSDEDGTHARAHYKSYAVVVVVAKNHDFSPPSLHQGGLGWLSSSGW